MFSLGIQKVTMDWRITTKDMLIDKSKEELIDMIVGLNGQAVRAQEQLSTLKDNINRELENARASLDKLYKSSIDPVAGMGVKSQIVSNIRVLRKIMEESPKFRDKTMKTMNEILMLADKSTRA